MSRLVTSSPTSGCTSVTPACSSSGATRAEEDEELLVLGGAEPVDEDGRAAVGGRGALGEHRLDQLRGQRRGGHPVVGGDAGLAVDAEAEVHLTGLDVEERLVGARHRAAVEGHAEGVRRRVGLGHHALDLVEVEPGLGGRAGDLVDGERAGDPAPLVLLVERGGGDVVGDVDDPGVDALGAEPVGGDLEVEPVAGVVAEAHDDAGATVGGPADPVDLLGRRGGEEVAEHGTVGEPGADRRRCRRGSGPTRRR